MSQKLSALKRWFHDHYDVSQETFAHQVGSTQSHISQFASGNTPVSDTLLERISRRTRIPIETLAKDNEANRVAKVARSPLVMRRRRKKKLKQGR